MAIALRGRRRLTIDGRIFYWDYREDGKKPGQLEPHESSGPLVLRVVSQDKKWRMTFDGHRAAIDDRGDIRRVRGDQLPKHLWRPFPITPRTVRQIVDYCLSAKWLARS
jgi:hypothetical protein